MNRRTARAVLTAPAAWVASLPSTWTSGPERLVLYVLVLDAAAGVSTSGQHVLAQRAGMGVGQLRTVLHSLCVPTDHRPPLIERLPARNRSEADRYRLAPRDRISDQRLLPLTGLIDA